MRLARLLFIFLLCFAAQPASAEDDPLRDVKALTSKLFDTLGATTSDLESLNQQTQDCNQIREPEKTIAACSKLVSNPAFGVFPGALTVPLLKRAAAYNIKREYDKALADAEAAIRLDPQFGPAYLARASILFRLGRLAEAMAETDKAFSLPTKGVPQQVMIQEVHNLRGQILNETRDYDAAIAEFDKATPLNQPSTFWGRGRANEAKGRVEKAYADYRMAAELGAWETHELDAQKMARERVAVLQPKIKRIESSPRPDAGPSRPLRRAALVIGNADYGALNSLPNPVNDARAIAAAFRRIGFQEVRDHYNLDYRAMKKALRDFENVALNADWAVIYFAGHGVEIAGGPYMLPTDIAPDNDVHIRQDSFPLEDVIKQIGGARKLRWIVYDACRDNPYMRRVTRNLAPRTPLVERGDLVVYSARKGAFAADGPAGGLSPFAKAMLDNMETTGLDLESFFRRVEDSVVAATNGQQRPDIYGLPLDERHILKVAPQVQTTARKQ